MEEKITITKSRLAAALKQWDEDAKAGKWDVRDDHDVYNDNAEYLIGLLKTG